MFGKFLFKRLNRASLMVCRPSGVRLLSSVQKVTNPVRKNPEIYEGYDPNRTLDDVDVYASTATRKPEPPTEFELYGHASLSHKNNFVVSDKESIHSVKEGGYVELDDSEMKKYLPDCITGEVLQEFEFSERNAWMVRDSTKLLCRLIEEFEYIHPKGAKTRDEDSSMQPQTVSPRPHLPGLTDRPERSDSVLQVYLHGNKISDEKRGSIGNYEITSGQGSLVENSVENILKGDEFNGPIFPRQIMVTGVRGTGKSFTMNQAVLYARKRGWLCMAVDGYRQAQLGWFIEPYLFKESRPGSDDIFDNCFMSAEVLRSFFRAHSEDIAAIPIKDRDAVVSKYLPRLATFREEWDRAKLIAGGRTGFIEMRRLIENEENFEEEDERDTDILKSFDLPGFEIQTLRDLILLGLVIRDFAGAVAMDLIDQLKSLESHRVLFAVDGYNAWEVPSAYQYDHKIVMPKQMCVPSSLNFLAKHKVDMKKWQHTNGLAIGFCSFKHPEEKDIYKEAFNSFHLVLKMPVYSSVEFLSAMRLYLEHSHAFDKTTTNQDLSSFRVLCASNPRLTRLESVEYFIPISSIRYEDTHNPFEYEDFGEFAELGDEDGGNEVEETGEDSSDEGAVKEDPEDDSIPM